MSKNLNKCFDKLKFIASIKSPILRKKLLISMSDDCLYRALQEIAKNTVEGNVKLSQKQKKKLNKFKTTILKLSNKKNNKREKMNLIKQSGGFLPIIIPTIASILTTLLK